MQRKTDLSRRDFLVRSAGVFALPFLGPIDNISALLGARAEDNGILVKILEKAKTQKWKNLPFGEIVGKVGQEFLGTPYVAKTLDTDIETENCIVLLDGLDCVTFFETSLGIARMICLGQTGNKALLKQVTLTRYRGGKINGFPSRLHYTADWMRDNNQKGTAKQITKTLPGNEKLDKLVNFMSNHPDSYPQLKLRPAMVKDIRLSENALNSAGLFYVPKHLVSKAEPKLQTGDIVGITTTIEGIDCSHTGLIFVDSKGVRRFMHASLGKKKVILDERLSDYLNSIPKHTGVMISRPIRPK